MKNNLFYQFFYFCWLQWGQRRIGWMIPVYEIHGCRFHAVVVAIPDFRQACIDIAKYLYKPVARNGIKRPLPKESGSGIIKMSFLILLFLKSLIKHKRLILKNQDL